LTEARSYLAEKALDQRPAARRRYTTFEIEDMVRIAGKTAIKHVYMLRMARLDTLAALKELDARLDSICIPTPVCPLPPTGTPDPGAPAPGGGGGGAAIPGIPGQAATILRSDPSPEAQAEFDSIFGAGAAKAVLGK
jgi:hypothetical protein